MTVTAPMSRAQLDVAMDNLDAWVPVMMAEHAPDARLDAFEGELRMIGEHVVPEDMIHFWTRAQSILRTHGLLVDDAVTDA